MLLAFDAGNTNTMLALFEEGKIKHIWRTKTIPGRSADEYAMIVTSFCNFCGLPREVVSDIVLSSVVPSLLFPLKHMAQKYFGVDPLIIEAGIKTGLVLRYDNPKQVGADQIANAVAGIHKYGGPLIIIDFGTATTICAVNGKNEYLGGTVSPGLILSAEALFDKAAMLPRVELVKPDTIIGVNTPESIQAGLVYGHIGLCDFIVKRMKEAMRKQEEIRGEVAAKITVIATGGLAGLLAEGIEEVDVVDKSLTMEGIGLIYQRNKGLRRKKGKAVGEPDEYAGR